MPSRFQSFDDPPAPAASAPRLAALRDALARAGLDGFVIPRADRYQNEYVAPCDERLAWLTGFTGSAGAAIVVAERAVLFVDGRYTLQAAEQVDPALFEIAHLADTPPSAWIEANLPAGSRLGYDPWLHTARSAEKLAQACETAGGALVAVAANPLDAVWTDRPAPPLGPVVVHDTKYAGEPAADKLARLRTELRNHKADALVISDPHAVAWLFNIRGRDIAHTPLPLAVAIVPVEGPAALFVDGRKLEPAVREALAGLTEIAEPSTFDADLARRAAGGASIRLDEATGPDAVARIVRDAGGKPVRGADPIALMKAVKNATEIDGSRAAHRRDGVALVRFLAWLDAAAGGGNLTEIDAVEALEQYRADSGQLEDVSFPTIAGAGPNGAIVHYRVTRRTNRRLGPGELFLIDSGAQYVDGTTDVTRTVALGATSDEMRDRFTRVLKGHVAIARAVFPDGTTGAQLDSFARSFLWAAGLDFDHGTGHGIGSYLSVHEGPARISKLGGTALARGMILSDEPGYYKTGAYGIRIENLLLVIEAAPVDGAEKPLNSFETLTLAPIDLRLVAPALMTADEIVWLDAYHARVRDVIGPLVDGATRDWLVTATRPLSTV
ncbi:MAG: aminopeptidase P family protein [Rhodoplanes sp.]|uniref:aminopeptidase P family protein n=1 Tax=Rhodoplanes sp. TaxID=1968906 RepID=UPI00182BE532|nr:aminopeptidase P family protein [Rhodoplanes sp.]NVO12640.1 aminopeptidase P family protein [Rhodoplanes sp.]